ncbi:hypothetical protein FEM48_Zijuj03G0167100 [Ziziphus jujuba var. spinosa]|uniref:Vinorine synthase-like n=1 Tax=Ziziphus jujuba var. spinosa TaxID=714518 RepID=A0A978VRG2_ZIZJJ|nr:hypothetical protein FEM48_Zijuj03G0167100 [Ziziphus jujuba var. spinosa]
MVNNMEVTIISKQIVKPSSQSLHHLKPYKLCLFDQLTPVTYPSLVFFYPIIAEHPNFNLPKTLTHLKNSLSETLTLFYPFSGRTKNNTLIHDFHVGHPKRVIYPDLPRSSSSFPPRDWPQNQLDLMDHLWFKESNYITRRFVFNAKSITRHGCFLVDIRIAKDFGVGTRGEFEAENEAAAVVGCLEALGLFDDEFLESLEGEDGFLTISGFLNQLEAMLSLESEKPDIFAFTSWNSSFFEGIDFGWGKPFWLGVMGKVGAAFRKLVLLLGI